MKKMINKFVVAAISLATLLITGSAWAAVDPTAVFSNFTGADSENGITVGGYTLKANGNTVAADGITISTTSGVTIEPTSGNGNNNVTVIVKYSGLTTTAVTQPTILIANKVVTSNGATTKSNNTGILLTANNSNKSTVYFDGTIRGDGNLTLVGSTKQPIPAASGRFVYSYGAGGGTGMYFGANDGTLDGSKDGGVKWSSCPLKSISIGSYRSEGTKPANAQPATGMKIEGIAVIAGTSYLDANGMNELAAFDFDVATRMYSNMLASSATVSAGTYGDITVPGAGYKATAYAARTKIEGGTGSWAGVIGPATDTATHTVSGWFKVDTWDHTIYGASAHAGEHSGYRLYCDSNGMLWIGKTNWNGGNFSWNGSAIQVTTTALEKGKWYYLTVAVTKASNARTATAAVFVNGVQVFSGSNTFATNLNGSSTCIEFDIGAGVSAAGLYIDKTAVTDVATIKSWATNPNLVEAAPAEVAVTVTGTQNLSSLAAAAGIADRRLVLNVTGEATLTIDEAISPKEISVNGSAALTIKNANNIAQSTFAEIYTSAFTGALTYEFDATTASFTADDALKNAIKTANGTTKFIFKGDDTNGATINFGDPGRTFATHLVFEGGTHALSVINGNRKFASGATGDNPTVLVKGNTTLNFTAKDLSGYSGSVDMGAIIRVNDDATLNFLQDGGNTFFYSQRLWLDPGALVTFNYGIKSNESAFRWYGGATVNSEQIYVPASNTDQTANPATIRKLGTGAFHLATDGTRGVAVFVGNNSKLVIDSPITTGNATSPFKKTGDGVLAITGDVAVGTVEVAAGTIAGQGTFTGLQLDSGVALDLSGYSDSTTAIASGNMTIPSGTAIRFPANFAEKATFKLCTGTLTSPTREIGATVYIGDNAVPVAGAMLTYDAENQTVAYEVPTIQDIDLTGSDSVTMQAIVDAVNAKSQGWAGDVAASLKAGAVLSLNDTALNYTSIALTCEGGVTFQISGDTGVANFAKFGFANVAGGLTIETATAINIDAGNKNLTYKYTGSGSIAPSITNVGDFTWDSAGTITGLNFGTSYTGTVTINNGTVSTTTFKAFGTAPKVTVDYPAVWEITNTATVDERGNVYTGITGDGTIRYSGSNWHAFPYCADMWAKTLGFQSEVDGGGAVISEPNKTFEIGSLSGTKGFRSDFGGGANDRDLRVTQSRNTTWSGNFTNGDRIRTMYVAGAQEKTLTIAGTFTNSDTLNVESTGSVKLTGTWKGDVTVNGEFGGLGSVIDASAITINAGAKIRADFGVATLNVAPTFGSTLNVTLPQGATANGYKILTLSGATPTYVNCTATVGGVNTYILEQKTDGVYLVEVGADGITIDVAADTIVEKSLIDGFNYKKTGNGTLVVNGLTTGKMTVDAGSVRLPSAFTGTVLIPSGKTLVGEAGYMPINGTLDAASQGTIKLPVNYEIGGIIKVYNDFTVATKPIRITDSDGDVIDAERLEVVSGMLMIKASEISTEFTISTAMSTEDDYKFVDGASIHFTNDGASLTTTDTITVDMSDKLPIVFDFIDEAPTKSYTLITAAEMVDATGDPLTAEAFELSASSKFPVGMSGELSINGDGELVLTVTSAFYTADVQALLENNANLLRRFDATRGVVTDANGVVTSWTDPSGEIVAQPYVNKQVTGAPTYGSDKIRKYVDFGAAGSGMDLEYERVTTARTVIEVLDIAQTEAAFLLGDKTTYQFHRGSTGQYGASNNAKFSTVRDNGEVVSNWTGTNIPTGFRVISLKLSQDCNTDCFASDRSGCDKNPSRTGGRKLSELLIFNTELTNEQFSTLETYLKAKWGLNLPHGVWDGEAGDNRWDTANNWEDASVPGAGSTVTIADDTPPAIDVTGTVDIDTINNSIFTINSDTIKIHAGIANSTITLAENGNLENYGWPTITGTVTINSDYNKAILSNPGNNPSRLNQSNATFVKGGTGTITLKSALAGDGNNTFNGVTVNAGKLILDCGIANCVNAVADLTLCAAGALEVAADKTLTVKGTIDLATNSIDANAGLVGGEGTLQVTETTTYAFPEGFDAGDEFVLTTGTLSAPTTAHQATITVGGESKTVFLSYDATKRCVSYSESVNVEITGEASISAINTQASGRPAVVTIKGENAAVKFDAVPAAGIKFVKGEGAPNQLTLTVGGDKRFITLAEAKQFEYEGFTSFKYSWAAGEVISLNFGTDRTDYPSSMTGEGKTDTLAGVQIPDASWINLTGGNSTDVAVDKFYDSDADATFDISGMTVSYNGGNNNTWKPGTQSNYPFMNGYLDDTASSHTSVTLENVPFSTYDVIVYMQGDAAGRKFTPIEVTQNATSTKYTYKDYAIVAGDWTATDDWGNENQTDISYEHNAIRITGLTGDAVIISPLAPENTSVRRSTLAAIQIVNTGTPLVTKWTGAGGLNWNDAQNWSAGIPTADTIAAFPYGVWLAYVNVTSESTAKLIYSDSTIITINGYGANFGGVKSNSPIAIEGDSSKDPITFTGEIASTGDSQITINIDSGIVAFDDVDCTEMVHLKGDVILAGSGTIRAVSVEKDAILKPNADGFVVTGAWAQNSGAEIKPIKIDCSLITASDVESAITLISLGSDCTGVINDVTFLYGATGLVFVKSADNKSIIASKTCIWTGAGADHNWSNIANWQGGVVPMAGIPVIINLGTDAGDYTINLPDSAVQVGSLTLSGSATSFAFTGTGSLSATSYNISGLTAATIDLSKTTFNADYTIPANSTLIVNGATWTSAATFGADTSKIRYAGTYTAIGGTFAGASENVKGTVEFGGTYNAAANTSFTDASVKYAIVGTVNVESDNFGFGTVEFSLEPGCAVTVAGNFLSGDGNGSKGYFNGGTLTANKIVIGTKGSGTGASEDYYFGDGSSANNTMVITANEIYNNYGGQSTGMHVHVRNGCTINLKSRIWSDATVNPSYRHWFLEGGKLVITDNCSILFQQLRSVTGTTEFEVADSKTLTLTVEAHGSLTKTGVIRKTGTGTIVFANNPAASFTIAAGTAIVDAGNEGTVSVDGEGSGVLKVKVAYAQWISGYNSTATIPEGKNIVFVLPDSSEIEGKGNVLPPKAADRKWVGTTDSNWNVATNWEPEGVPGANDSVEIDSTDKEIAITVPNGGVTVDGITFKGGNAIALTGDAINVGVVVKADAGSAEFVGGTIATSIQVVGGTLAISGDYTLPATIATESGATLELDVASAKTITSVISGAGAFKKTGAGTLTMNGLSSYTGGTTVEAGGIVFGATSGNNVGPIGAYYTNSTTDWDYNKAVVKNGAFIDVNGMADMCYTFDLEAGAVLKNAGSTIGDGSRQTRRVALLGNATVDAVSNAFGIHNGGHNATQLALGEYTLTKIGNGAFELVNTVISGTGTIDVQAGTLWFNTRGSAMNDGTIKLGADGALQVSANATVKNLIANNTAITGNGTLIVTGLLDLSAVENNTLQAVNLTLTEGMTFKFPAGYMGESKFTLCSGTLTPASGTLNANIDFGNTIEQVQLVIADKGITFEFSDTTWTGGESGEETDWDVATNWTHGVPKATTAVTIPADANISLTSASIASSITLEGSATLTMDGVTAANIKSIAVPTGATLTINVEEGNTATVGLISGAGAVAKSGVGTLELSGANTYTGGTTIKNGVVKRTNTASFGAANSTVEVKSGASLDWGDDGDAFKNCTKYNLVIAGSGFDPDNGKTAFYYSANTGNRTLGANQRHPISLTLAGDATIGGACNFGFMNEIGNNNYAVVPVNLGGYTLTKVGAGTFYTSNLEFRNGTVVIEEGTLSVINNYSNDTFQSDAKLVVGENGHLEAFRNPFTVYDVEFTAAENTIAKNQANHLFMVKGTVVGSFTSAAKLEIAAGATIPVTSEIVASSELTLPTDGTINIDLGTVGSGNFRVITAPNGYEWDTTKITLVGSDTTDWNVSAEGTTLVVSKLPLDATVDDADGYNFGEKIIEVDVTKIDSTLTGTQIKVVTTDKNGTQVGEATLVPIDGSKGKYEVTIGGLTAGNAYNFNVTFVDSEGNQIEQSKEADLENIAVGTIIQGTELFSADATSGESDVDGGDWDTEPTISEGAYVIDDETASVFEVESTFAPEGNYTIEYELTFEAGFTTELTAEETAPIAGITIGAGDEDGTFNWYRADSTAADGWSKLDQTVDPGHYLIRMAFTNTTVTYSVKGDEDTNFVTLTQTVEETTTSAFTITSSEISSVSFQGASSLAKFGAKTDDTIDTTIANENITTVEGVVAALNTGNMITLKTNVAIDTKDLAVGEYTIGGGFDLSFVGTDTRTIAYNRTTGELVITDVVPLNKQTTKVISDLNLNPADKADIPFVKAINSTNPNAITFKLFHGAGANEKAVETDDSANANAKFFVESCDNASFTGEGVVIEKSPSAGVKETLDVPLPTGTNKVKYYRLKLDAK